MIGLRGNGVLGKPSHLLPAFWPPKDVFWRIPDAFAILWSSCSRYRGGSTRAQKGWNCRKWALTHINYARMPYWSAPMLPCGTNTPYESTHFPRCLCYLGDTMTYEHISGKEGMHLELGFSKKRKIVLQSDPPNKYRRNLFSLLKIIFWDLLKGLGVYLSGPPIPPRVYTYALLV